MTESTAQSYEHARSTKRVAVLLTMIVALLLSILAVLIGMSTYVLRRDQHAVDDARFQIRSNAWKTVKVLDNAVEQYKLDTGNYPMGDRGLEFLVSNEGGDKRWNGPYLKQGAPMDPWIRPYRYRRPSVHGLDYEVFSMGPDAKVGTKDDIGNWTDWEELRKSS